MYDDLLGKPKRKDLDGVIFPAKNRMSKHTVVKPLNYRVDEKTPNGHVYLRKDMDEALTKAIKRNLWLVSKIDKNQDPAMVIATNIIGQCINHWITKDDSIMVEIKYIKKLKPYNIFDITTASFGLIDKKSGVVTGLVITQLYMI